MNRVLDIKVVDAREGRRGRYFRPRLEIIVALFVRVGGSSYFTPAPHIHALNIGSCNLPTGPRSAISHVATSLGIPRSRWTARRYRAEIFSYRVSVTPFRILVYARWCYYIQVSKTRRERIDLSSLLASSCDGASLRFDEGTMDVFSGHAISFTRFI